MSIVLKNIRRTFGTFQALRGINLEIADDQLVALLGPSGSGKTTLLRIIGGTSTYLGSSGRGTFAGERMDAIGGAVKSHFILRVER